MNNILITGTLGQIGSELVLYLRKRYGADKVIASAWRSKADSGVVEGGPFEILDVTDAKKTVSLVKKHQVGTIYHLASILSAKGEKDPQKLWKVNMDGLVNVLEAARIHNCSVFFPSSVAVFGPGTPKDNTPQNTITRPTTIYGISKITGELLCNYYHQKFGLDIRGLRYPGLISNAVLPGGGTTDYAVHIFYDALKYGKHSCFLRVDSTLDMIYMPDALRGAVQLMEADSDKLIHRNAYNVSAMSFTPDDLYLEIKKHLPDFQIEYNVDPERQSIADSWPNSLDDSTARAEWGWDPEYDLAKMTADMLEVLEKKIKAS